MEAFGGVLPHEEETRRWNPQRPDLLQDEILNKGNVAPFRTSVDMYRKGVDFFPTKGSAPDDLQTELSMPGNEVAEKVHNFFEQDSLSHGQHQSQVASGNWSVLDDNLWLNNQRQNDPHQFSHQRNYNGQSSDAGGVIDSENVNGRQSSRMPFGPNLTQLSLRPDVGRSQTRNQQLTTNGFLHNPQSFQTRSNQAEFLGEDTLPDRHNLALRTLAILESQGQTPEHSSGLTRSSERLESADAPVNFDFLGSQQQLTRRQQPGISQPQPRQQAGLSDVQLWQQHYVYKHMQELQRQRQRQLQQLDQEASQQHSLSQLSVLTKQAAGDPLPVLVNGAPIHNASNFLWPTELVHQMGGDPKIPSSSQTFMVGSTSWARSGPSTVQGFPNGLMLSQDQGQGLRSMGFLPQQFDQSLYGASVAGSRNNLIRPTNPYSSFQGISQDGSDMLTKAGGTQVEKPVMQSNAFSSFHVDQGSVFSDRVCAEDGVSVSKQSFHGKNLFGQGPNVLQTPNSGAMSGNFQQIGSLPKNVQFQEFHGRQERAGWPGSLEGTEGLQIGPSQGLVSLDPTEEKILYNTSDNLWDNAGGFMHSNQLEGTDYVNVFPSVQSGSWSALMQSAAAEASSSDTGIQDEWSGLSFQKTELSPGNPARLNDSGNQSTTWSEHNVQAASLSSRPLPLFDESNVSPSGQSGPGFQQTTPKLAYEQSERAEGKPQASHGGHSESLQQSTRKPGKWLDNSPRQKPFLEGRLPTPARLENAAESGWTSQTYEQSESIARSEDVDVDAQNMHSPWAHQQSVPSYKISSQSCNKPNGWNINESLSPNGDNLQIRDNQQGDTYRDDNQVAVPFPNSIGGMEVKCNTDSPQLHREDACVNNFTPMPNNTLKTNQAKNQQILNSHQLEFSKHVVVDSYAKYQGNENVGRYQNQPHKHSLAQESSMNSADRGSSEIHSKRERVYHKESSNDSYISGNVYPGHQSFTGSGGRESAWLGGSDSRPSIGSSQKLSGQIGRKASGPRKFQYHPMGNLDMDVTQTDTTEHAHSQGLSHPVSRGPKASEQGYYGNPKFVGGGVSSSAVDMEKGHLDPDPQNNRKGAEEASSQRVLTGYGSAVPASFAASAVFYVPNKRTVQTSQNMLELLNKVDQPMENNLMRFGSCEMSEPAGSNASVAQLQQNQSSASQGFGLRLAPPSQRIPISKPGWSSQTSQAINDLNSRHIDPEVGSKGQTWLPPPATVQSLPHTHEISQQEYWGNKTSLTGQTGNELSSGGHRGQHSNFQENASTAFGAGLYYSNNQLHHQHISSSDLNSEVVTDQHPSFAGPNDQSAQGKLASCFRQAHDSQDGPIAESSSAAFSSELLSHERSGVSSHSEPTNTNSSHLAPVMASQVSATSGDSQQGTFSTMLHNVWTNRSTQQRVLGAPLKVSPSLFPSISSSSSTMEPTSRAAEKVVDQNIGKGGRCPSEFGPCSINAQQFASGDEQLGKDSSLQQTQIEREGVTRPHIPSSPVNLPSSAGYNLPPQTGGGSLFQSHGQEHMTKHLSSANSVTSSSSVVHTGQDIGRERHRQDPSFVSQTEHVSLQKSAISDRDIEVLDNSGKPSGALQNYSLLSQLQAMKSAENDLNKKGVKRLKVVESGNDVSQVTSTTSHHFAYGYSTMANNSSVDNEPKAEQHTQYPQADAKRVSFSLVGAEDQSENRDGPSQDMITSGENDHQNQSFSLTSAPSSLRAVDHSQLNPQAGPSWFDQFGTYKNGQILAMYDGLDVSRNPVKTAAQQFFFGGVSGGVPAHSAIEERHADDANLVGTALQNAASIVAAHEHLASSQSSPLDTGNQPLTVVRLKKRKRLVPWHKEVTHGSQRLRNISEAELEWARAANRRIEKVDDEVEMIDDGLTMPRTRRRLILTTQLMQQLLRSVPASILSAEASSDDQTVTYFIAKVALGDACNLVSSSGSDSCLQPDNKNSTFGKLNSSERVGGQIVSKVVEDYICRAKKLESDLLRLDKRAWFLDLRVECQDLERFTILNRFARFHRGNADGVESSSASEAAARKLSPQRYVTAVPIPRNLPEGVPCLSL